MGEINIVQFPNAATGSDFDFTPKHFGTPHLLRGIAYSGGAAVTVTVSVMIGSQEFIIDTAVAVTNYVFPNINLPQPFPLSSEMSVKFKTSGIGVAFHQVVILMSELGR